MSFASDLFALDGKTAVVTGASSGIGSRIARTLVLAGARVAAIARREAVLDDEAMATGRVHAFQADLADRDATVAVAGRCLDAFDGRVDILVNNAGYAPDAKAEDETEEAIRRTLAVNLEAPIILAQACQPAMRDAGAGSIINVGSVAGEAGVGRIPMAIYAATKGGISAISREWAAQWSRYGIRVNTLVPGWFATEMTASFIDVPKINEWMVRNSLIPRTGQVDDIDGAVLLLASDAGRYITGQQVVVDGGWLAR